MLINSAEHLQQACCAAVDGYVSGLTHLQQVINGVGNTPNSSLVRQWSFGEIDTAEWLSTRPMLWFSGWKKGRGRMHFGTVAHVFWHFLANYLFSLLFQRLNIPLRSRAFS